MYGAFVIDSMPPVTTSSTSPARIIESAISTARTDEAQTLLIASAGVSIGRPAATDACRAGACPAPPWSTWPMITYCGSSGSMPARSSAARIAIPPSSVAERRASPPPRRPNGVRTAPTMTLRTMASRLAHEVRIRRQSTDEGNKEADHRLQVVEGSDLRWAVHVPDGNRDDPRGNAAPARVDVVGVGVRPPRQYLDRVRDAVCVRHCHEQVGQ